MKKNEFQNKARTLNEQFNQSYYLDKLADYHRMFYAVFELGFPIHTRTVETAAVGYNSAESKINFLINPDFFYNLGENEQLFIVCHEASHVIFNHIERTFKYGLDPYISNIAQDIVINEMLVHEFGFLRSSLSFSKELCFIDTVFQNKHIKSDGIVYGKSFEFYYEKLLKYKAELKIEAQLLDIHIGLNEDGKEEIVVSDHNGEIVGKIPHEISQHISDKIGYQMSADELKEIIEKMSHCGNEHFGREMSVKMEKEREKPWQLLIKNKIATLQKIKEQHNETFRIKPRRIINLPKDLYLPENIEEETFSNDKFNAFFFIDASGSCVGHVKKFFNLIRTVPQKHFHIHTFSFDANTYPLDIKYGKVRGGGGTSFSAIEHRVQSEITTNKLLKKKYPDLVFVLSDGGGNEVNPEKPEQWYFMLTQNSLGSLPLNSNYAFIHEFKQGKNKIYKKQ